jgi:hypothetical protein
MYEFKKKSALIFQVLMEYIWSDELKNQGRMSVKNFIRERVLTFPVLVSFLINLAKKSLQVSLNDFCKASDLLFVTKQAFSKARKKLSPNVFILLNRKLVEEYYSDNLYSTWKGFRLIAVDGSDIQLPNKENVKMKFGCATNQHGSKLAMAKISYAYDVLNHITLDSQIGYCKSSERDLAVNHIEAIQQLKHDKTNDLYIYDRGYPSLGLLFYLSNAKKDFLIRCSISSCFAKVKQVLEQGKEDTIIRLYANEANDDQIKELKKRTPSLDRKNAYLDLRVIVVLLSTGEKEILITSLLDHKLYPKKEFKGLYNLRWGVEENYKWHKVALELENFSGSTELAIEQEFFSLVFTANMASLLIEEAQGEIEEEHKGKSLKHTFKINKRTAISTLRNQLLKGILEPGTDMDELCNNLKADLKKSLCPVRPNRKFARPKKGRQKYGCTTRKSI